MPSTEIFKQIWLNYPNIQDAEMCGDSDYVDELEKFRASLQKSSQAWLNGYDLSGSPLPVLIPQALNNHLEKLADILYRVISSIVERWFDPQETFTERMPLLSLQENVLRWMNESRRSLIKPFATQRGVWRPDFLLTAPTHHTDNRDAADIVRICEINARFAFNGFFNVAFAHEAFDERKIKECGLESPVKPERIFEAFKNMLDVKKPVHILKGQEYGLDVHLYHSYLQDRCGIDVRFIKPEDLRLINGRIYCMRSSNFSDDRKNKGRAFAFYNGEVIERIHQVALELHQRELEDLGEHILKAIAPVCFNDLRTIYLVHDKRMLGIVLEELRGSFLSTRTEEGMEKVPSYSLAHIVSAEEAELLYNAIIPTFIPGSKEIRRLVRDTETGLETKDLFLMKPIGSGKGNGIVFGSEISTEDWLNTLEGLSEARVKGAMYVVQPLIQQAKFEVIVPEKGSRSTLKYNHFVGTFMMINGRYLGPGWRTGSDPICAVSHGGSWLCNFMNRSKTAQNTRTSNGYHLGLANVPRIKVATIDESQDIVHINVIHAVLRQDGILILDLNFDDLASEYLTGLIKSLQVYCGHSKPLTHSSTRGVFWEVKPDPARMAEQNSARSETMADFPWHTDCSYDSKPPDLFALQVIQADRCGGGTLSVLESEKVMESLSGQALEALSASEFLIKVPPEFRNGTDSIQGRLLSISNGSPTRSHLRFRFRADIVEPLTSRARNALEELGKVLATARDSEWCINLTADILPNRSIVLLDNHRWLHSRNIVKDSGKHLRRIRWDGQEF